MKKLLLTLAAIVGLGFAASADEVTFDFTTKDYGLTRQSENNSPYINDGTVVKDGALSITLKKASDKNGWRLWTDGLRIYKNSSTAMVFNATDATINSIEISKKSKVISSYTLNGGTAINVTGESFTVNCSGSEVNLGLATSNNGAIYTIKVTYTPAGNPNKNEAGLSFAETNFTANLGDDFTAPKLTNPNNLAVTYASSNEDVATVAADGKVTLVGAGTTTITATSAETAEFNAGYAFYTLTVNKPVVTKTVTLATTMSDGKYAIYTPQGVAKNYTGSNASFGYLFLEAVTPENNEFSVNEDYLIEFTATDKGYTMKDSKGVYLGMDASHFGSFNFYSNPDAEGSNCYWDVTFDENNNAIIENKGRSGVYISYKEFSGDWELNTTDKADQPLVQLYKEKIISTAITEIEAAENAPVEYFNLQGVRVANPENGLYIRRQGNKVTKVIVK